MNSRERVLKAVNFEKPDRVPIDLGAIRASGINAVVYDQLKKRMGIDTSRDGPGRMLLLAYPGHFSADSMSTSNRVRTSKRKMMAAGY
jgi:hypothetical protein